MSETLRVNPIRCTAHGMCAEILPEHVQLDDWGYPVISAASVPEELLDLARMAVSTCPALALKLERAALPRDRVR